MSEIINITGMWKNKSKDGTEYLKGSLGYADIMIFPNKNRQNDKSPHYTLCMAPKKKKEDEDRPRSTNRNPPPPEDETPF